MLPTLPPKKPKRNVALTVRVAKDTVEQLKALQTRHNLSQSHIIELLIAQAFDEGQPPKRRKTKG